MEIKKWFKSNLLEIISAVLTIVFTATFIIIYLARITLLMLIFSPLYALSLVILAIMFMIVLNKYIYAILKNFKQKKYLKSILLIALIIILFLTYIFLNQFNYQLKRIILYITIIIAYISFPLITLGVAILSDRKKKVLNIIISVILLLYIYLFNGYWLFLTAKDIVAEISNTSFSELIEFKEKDEFKTNITYLNNYTQKMARDGYLSQWDVKQILEITDSKSTEMFINYKDDVQNIELNITNKDDQKIDNLINNDLKSDYYKFNYETNDKNEITINIERYKITRNDYTEKNEDIILTGDKNTNIIQNKHKYISEDKETFIFDNDVITSTDSKELNGFKILFVYDEEQNNFIPVVNDMEEFNCIQSYKVYQSAVEIILKEDVELKNKDYTIRANRYDKELNISKNSSYYFYEYEPVVTQGTTYKNKIVLEMKFDRSYTLQELKNIEIIFGK